MENISITIITAIAFIWVVLWLCKKYRCKRCGGAMDEYYHEKTGKTWKICTRCGHSELVGGEASNESPTKN